MQVQSSLSIHSGLVPGPLQIPKYTDAQVPCIKWLSTGGPPGPRMQNLPTKDRKQAPRVVESVHAEPTDTKSQP